MKYHRYETECFILGVYPKGENDAFYKLYTREFGMVFAYSNGARKEKSKLRPALIWGAYSQVSLVRGKEYWKIVGSESKDLPWKNFIKRKRAYLLAIRIIDLLERLISGESRDDRIFKFLDFIHKNLTLHDRYTDREIDLIEVILTAELLSILGYIPSESVPKIPYESFDDSRYLFEALDKRMVIEELVREGMYSANVY